MPEHAPEWPRTFGPAKPPCPVCGATRPLLLAGLMLPHYPQLHMQQECWRLQCKVCGTEWTHGVTH